jgi:hypothetical protein
MKPPLKTYPVYVCLYIIIFCYFCYVLEDPTCLGIGLSTQEMFVLMWGHWLFIISPIIGVSGYGKGLQTMVLNVLTLAKMNK